MSNTHQLCELRCPVLIWGVPKIRGTILVVPIARNIVFSGLYWGPLILGNYHTYDMHRKG